MAPPVVYRFVPRITYENPTTMSAVANGITLPKGLADTIPEPLVVTKADFDILLAADEGRKDKTLTFGLVTAKFSAAFADLATQWVKVDYQGAPFWQFTGGDIYVDVRLGLYIYDHYRLKPKDPCTYQVMALLVGHELLHIADEIDIITNWFPTEVKKYSILIRLLEEMVTDKQYRDWFLTPYFSQRLHDDVWCDEHIRRIEGRDTAREYAAISDEVRNLQMKCKHGK